MKDLVLKITKENWGMKVSHDLDNMEWEVYSDYTVDVRISYVDVNTPKVKSYKITKELYDEIVNNIELSKNISIEVKACDGEAWKFIQYDKGKEIWRRDLGYIYGIESLEKICNTLLNLINKRCS